jgi:S-formylglutathione hydrolase FrmB
VWLRRSAVALLAVAVVTAAGVETHDVLSARTVGAGAWPAPVDVTFGSDALRDEIGLRVYLPPGYATTGRRYPVVYFLHGLPASSDAYKNTDFLRRAMAALGRDAIVVAIQGARGGEPDTEYLDSGPGHNWETAITSEVTRVVDRRFRTIATRRGRAIVGVSAGGYGSMLIGVHHLGEYAAIESWSGYFHPTDPTGTVGLDLGSVAKNTRANLHSLLPGLARALKPNPTFIAFYVGSNDRRFRAENEQLDRELTGARIPHLFELYPGAHVQSLWNSHASVWLGLALDHLARPETG